MKGLDMRNAARPQMVRTAVIETTESSNRYVKNVNSYVTLYSQTLQKLGVIPNAFLNKQIYFSRVILIYIFIYIFITAKNTSKNWKIK